MSVLQSEGVIPPSHICKRGKETLDVLVEFSEMLGNVEGY